MLLLIRRNIPCISPVVTGLYYEALNAFDSDHGVTRAVTGPNATGMIFSTYPSTYAGGRSPSVYTCVASEVVGTAVLVAGVFALTDKNKVRRLFFTRPRTLTHIHTCALVHTCTHMYTRARYLTRPPEVCAH